MWSRRAAKALVCLRLASLMPLAACGTAIWENTVRVVLLQAPARCGPAPWTVYGFDPYSDYSADAAWAGERAGASGPDTPYVATVGSGEVRWAWDRGPARQVEVGLFLPCLRSDGWWLLTVTPPEAGPGTARFCPWGWITPDADAPTIRYTALATPARHGAWDLTLRVDLSSVVSKPRPEPPAGKKLPADDGSAPG